MTPFEFACGGLAFQENADARHFDLDVQGDRKNVNLRISDISRSMASNIPDMLIDLLEIAAYVYCADQHAGRGSAQLSHAGGAWRRDMSFIIPVRLPDLWSSPDVSDALASTLNYLSDDAFHFRFIPATKPLSQGAQYFPEFSDGAEDPDEIALFSGGLDSFAGAVETIVGERKRTILVGHHSASKVFSIQKELARQVGCGKRAFYVPVNVTNSNNHATEMTQRTRSFLFASLAFVIAQMFKKDSFTFFENGVVSFNLPIARDVLGARATRTTHPTVIRGFQAVFSALAQQQIEIRTPFLWSTKKEIVDKIVQNGFGHLLATTASCAHPHLWSTEMRHCGVCSQCLDRRFAILAAGAEHFEPARDYGVDLLTGNRRRDEDLRMAVAYLKFCQSIEDGGRHKFVQQFPQVVSVLADIPGLSSEQALARVWDLHQRHAAAVLGVVEQGVRAHGQDLIRGRLPPSSIISLCVGRTRVVPTPALDYDQQLTDFIDRLSPPVCEFAVDAAAQRICFKGAFFLKDGDYRLIAALLDNHRLAKSSGEDVALVHPMDLADKLGIQEPSVRQRIIRTRNKIIDRLAVDQGIVSLDGFIENTRSLGYRLSPELREVTLSVLLASDRAMSQRAMASVTQQVSGS